MRIDFDETDFLNDKKQQTDKPEQNPARRVRRKKKNSALVWIIVLVFGIMTGSTVTSLIVENKYQKREKELIGQQSPVQNTEAEEGEVSGEENPVHEITEEDIEELRVEQEDIDSAAVDNDTPVEINWENPENVEEETEYESQPLTPGVVGGEIDMEQLGITDESNYSAKEAQNGLEILKQSLMNGDGTVPALRKAFKNDTMVISNGKFYFFPIDDNYVLHSYSNDNLFNDEQGRLNYAMPDGTYAKRGVDVSKYQGEIQWDKVAEDGIEFAFIRAGVRGYETGKLVMEEDFMTNAIEASNQGIEIGVYFFSQAVNEEEAIEEADSVLAALNGNEIAYPVVYDIENVKGGRVGKLTKQQLTENCLAFCNRISEAGYTPMIYGNMESFLVMLDMEKIEGIEKWFAYYTPEFYFPYEFRIWQYSDKGHVNGINGNVDVNLCFY